MREKELSINQIAIIYVLIVLITVFIIPRTTLALTLNDGGDHIIDYPYNIAPNDTISVYNTTTVTLVDGSDIGYVKLYEDSTGNFSGGFLIDLTAYDNSKTTISTTNVYGFSRAYGNSSLTQSGGNFYGVDLYDNSTFTKSGGSSDAIFPMDNSTFIKTGGHETFMHPHGSSDVIIHGGDIYVSIPGDSSKMTFYGGYVSNDFLINANSEINIFGLDGNMMAGDNRASGDSTINIYGSNFNLPFGTYTAADNVNYFTGTLWDGSSLEMWMNINDNARVVLMPIPVASIMKGYLDSDGDVDGNDLETFSQYFGTVLPTP